MQILAATWHAIAYTAPVDPRTGLEQYPRWVLIAIVVAVLNMMLGVVFW